jgi:hypothetical protein
MRIYVLRFAPSKSFSESVKDGIAERLICSMPQLFTVFIASRVLGRVYTMLLTGAAFVVICATGCLISISFAANGCHHVLGLITNVDGVLCAMFISPGAS